MTLTKRGEGGFGSTGVYATELQNNRNKITELEHKTTIIDKHSYKTGPLSEEQKVEVYNLIEEFKDILATDFSEIKRSKLHYLHDVDTGDTAPIYQRQYPIPQAYQAWV